MRCATCLALVLVVGACGPSALDGGFDSANPAARMYAVEQAARAGDRTAVARIIEQLDSDDPALRFMAIGALERLTGQTMGYHHHAPPDERQAAIVRWERSMDGGMLIIPVHHADQSTVESDDD